MLQTAHDALARRDAEAALAAARAALDSDPEQADAHHALGLALRLSGQFEEAARALDRAAELDPERAAYQFARASLALARRQLETAESALEQTLQLDPNLLPAYVLGAHLALGHGDRDKAEALTRRAERVSANHPLTLCMRGNLALAAGQHAEAQRELHRAAERAPDEPLVLSSLAMAYVAAGNYAFAEQALRRVLDHDPTDLRLRRLLIVTLSRQQRSVDVVAELDVLLGYAPDDWASLALLGDSRLALGDRDGALEAYRRLLSCPAAPTGALDATLRKLAASGDDAVLASLLDERLAAAPDDDGVWQRRLMIAADAERPALVARWRAARPASALALQAEASDAERRGDLAAAERSADLALAIDPALLPTALIKIRAELRQAPELALQRLDGLLADRAATPGTTVDEALLRLRAIALDRLGRYAEAAEALATAAAQHAGSGALPAPRPAGPAVEAAEAAEAAGAVEPRLLWGLPGSRVFGLVDALRQVAGIEVLEDRFGRGARPDGLWPPRSDGAVATGAGWAALLARANRQPEQIIDWLPQWDPRIGSALPTARLLVVLDDPRDLLLNWLTFGTASVGASPAQDTADWLLAVLEPLADRVAAGDARLCLLDSTALAAADGDWTAQVQQFFDLPECPPADAAAATPRGAGGLPMAFAPGRWRQYAAALEAPFATLRPLAVRLGYPAD